MKEIKPVNPKGNQPWIFIGRTDAEAEAPILWPPDEKNWLIGEDPDAGKDWGQEEKGTTEDEMVGWHHWFNGHGFEQTLGDGEGQRSLVCCSPWGCKESDMTEWTTIMTPTSISRNKSSSSWLSTADTCWIIYVSLLTLVLRDQFPAHSPGTVDSSHHLSPSAWHCATTFFLIIYKNIK